MLNVRLKKMMKIRRQHFMSAIVGAFFFLPGLVLWLYVPSKNSMSAGGVAERVPMFGWYDDIGGKRYGILFYPRTGYTSTGSADKNSYSRDWEFGALKFNIAGRSYWRTRNIKGAHPVTTIVSGGHLADNPVLIEYILMVFGVLIALLPWLPLVREFLNGLTRRAS